MTFNSTDTTFKNADATFNIILTGFMGSGKTTVGRIIAERLGWRFVDTDMMIEARHGSVSKIVTDIGWPGFRKLESEIAQEIASVHSHSVVHSNGVEYNQVIATGGRMMIDPHCAQFLEPTGKVVWLKATPETIIRRITADHEVDPTKRPLLQQHNSVSSQHNSVSLRQRTTQTEIARKTEALRTEAQILELLKQRTELYSRFESVDTTNSSPEQVASAVIDIARHRKP